MVKEILIQKGDKVTLLPQEELLEVFIRRCFFKEDFRLEASEKLGGKTGIISNIEQKYARDFFYFLPDVENESSWTIPYESIDFSKSYK